MRRGIAQDMDRHRRQRRQAARLGNLGETLGAVPFAIAVTAIPARTAATIPAWLRLWAAMCHGKRAASSAPVIAARNTQPSG